MTLSDHLEALAASGQASKAVALLREEVARRNGEAAYILGTWSMAGDHLARDIVGARDHFRHAFEWGFAGGEDPYLALLASSVGGLERDWQGVLAHLASAGADRPNLRRQCALIDQMNLDPAGNPDREYKPEFVSQDPLVVLFRGFLSDAECRELISTAKPRLAPATVVDPHSGQLVRDPVRDSLSTAFPLVDENPFIHAINRRIAAASRSRVEQGEPLQVLAYEPGQQYHLHSDALPSGDNQRIQTFLVYLNDDYEGGATHFPHGDLRLRPNAGDAVCFSNVDTLLRPSPTARHAGLPVKSGTKFILSRWIRRLPLDLGVGKMART